MKKVKDSVFWLLITAHTVSILYILSIAWIITLTHERNEARNDANEFFNVILTLQQYKDTQIRLDSLISAKKQQEWDALIQAIIIVESEGIEDAVGDGGKAVGVLQIHPSVIEDVRTAGYNYSLNDRYSREKSIEIWNIWQSIYNPDQDIHYAIKRHNPRISVAAHDRIIRLKDIILNQ